VVDKKLYDVVVALRTARTLDQYEEAKRLCAGLDRSSQVMLVDEMIGAKVRISRGGAR
jgi:hypothetical protein